MCCFSHTQAHTHTEYANNANTNSVAYIYTHTIGLGNYCLSCNVITQMDVACCVIIKQIPTSKMNDFKGTVHPQIEKITYFFIHTNNFGASCHDLGMSAFLQI